MNAIARRRFSSSRELCFFHHAGMAAIPRAAADALREYADEASLHGFVCRARRAAKFNSTRALVAEKIICAAEDERSFIE
ncbi:MAG TPA: hypothetical protein VM141_04795 [Planctomycetota bacterium]|nr:hypothetical protein [Planctomycetota bacterium]